MSGLDSIFTGLDSIFTGVDSIFTGVLGFGGARRPVSQLAHSACMPSRWCEPVRVRVFGGARCGCQSPADEKEGEREATPGSFSPDLSTLCNRGKLLLPGCPASMLTLPERRQNRSGGPDSSTAESDEPTGAAGGSLSGPQLGEGFLGRGFCGSNVNGSVRTARVGVVNGAPVTNRSQSPANFVKVNQK